MENNNNFSIDGNIVLGVKRMLFIEESCDLCGTCVKLCPFEALKLSKDGDIMFKPNACISECEVCRLSCPKKAIEFSYISQGCQGNCASCCSSCESKCKNSNKI